MQKFVSGVIITASLFAWAAVSTVSAQGGFSVTVDNLPPGSTLELAMNGGKIGTASTSGAADGSGVLTLVLDAANLGKVDTPVEVYIGDKCPDKQIRLWIVEQGMEPPPECDRKPIGGFIWHKARRITIHFPGSLVADNGGASLTRNQKILIGAGGAAVVVGVVAAGGGSSTTSPTTTPTATSTPTAPTTPTPTPTPPPTTTTLVPAGTYTVTITVGSDPNGHNPFVQYMTVTQITVTGSGTITITGNSVWCTVSGTIGSDGSFTATGTGFIAGRSNVQVRFPGKITAGTGLSPQRTGTLANETLSGQIIIGEGPTLPNGPITYNITGKKQ